MLQQGLQVTDNSADRANKLSNLAGEVAACSACPLASTRTKAVFGEGNPNAPLMIVGEGPGEREDATGRPFVGRAGVLLDECLAQNDLTRRHVYIANIVKCRACNVSGARKSNRPPTPSEAELCTPWLMKQFEIVKPLVLLCLGSPAANALIHRNFKIMQERGRFFESEHARWAIAALHPAYILRQGGMALRDARSTLVADIAAARQKVIDERRSSGSDLF